MEAGKYYIAKNKEVIFTALDEDEGVLLSLDTKCYYSLNSTGLFIWRLLNGRRTIEDILAIMIKDFSVAREKINNCVLKFIKSLEAEKLVTLSKTAKDK